MIPPQILSSVLWFHKVSGVIDGVSLFVSACKVNHFTTQSCLGAICNLCSNHPMSCHQPTFVYPAWQLLMWSINHQFHFVWQGTSARCHPSLGPFAPPSHSFCQAATLQDDAAAAAASQETEALSRYKDRPWDYPESEGILRIHEGEAFSCSDICCDLPMTQISSTEYIERYGANPVWGDYRRNHKGGIPPQKTRKTCIVKCFFTWFWKMWFSVHGCKRKSQHCWFKERRQDMWKPLSNMQRFKRRDSSSGGSGLYSCWWTQTTLLVRARP